MMTFQSIQIKFLNIVYKHAEEEIFYFILGKGDPRFKFKRYDDKAMFNEKSSGEVKIYLIYLI